MIPYFILKIGLYEYKKVEVYLELDNKESNKAEDKRRKIVNK